MKRTIQAICTGTARPFNGAETSAIAKRPREGLVQILKDGFAPDEQADRRVHGGPEKAVHLYPLNHHETWREQIGDHDLLKEPGAFGSNLAVEGIDETHVHIGDRFRCGTALIEISQPRQPCWKIEHRFGHKGMVAHITQTGRCGWYFRVIEQGEAQAGDALERIATGDEGWPVQRAFLAVMQKDSASREELQELATLERLSSEFKRAIMRKLG